MLRILLLFSGSCSETEVSEQLYYFKEDIFMKEVFFSDQMILIGSSGRNAGKTTLAEDLIHRWKDSFPITALKVTTIADKGAACHRGVDGCGICTAMSAEFLLEKTSDYENYNTSNKDTSKLLRAGASHVFWLRSLKASLKDGYCSFMEKVLPDSLVICESNSLREFVKPGGFIMLVRKGSEAIKPSAAGVFALADITIESMGNWEEQLSRIYISRTEQGYPKVQLVRH
jgi:hypothetical protein